MWFGARAKGSEARVNLARLCHAQLRHLNDAGTPATRYRALAEEIQRGNRYGYFVDTGPTLEERTTDGGTPDDQAVGVQVDLPRFGSKSIEYRVSAADVPAHLAGGLTLGGNGACPDCAWAFVALGNIDLDRELDVWSAATVERRTEKGEVISSCQPFHEHDDIPPGPMDSLTQ